MSDPRTTSTPRRPLPARRTGPPLPLVFFFFNDTATTEIYTLSLHDALPIYPGRGARRDRAGRDHRLGRRGAGRGRRRQRRSEEHTSELQSRLQLVCRLLLENTRRILAWPARSCAPAPAGMSRRSIARTTAAS